MNPFEALVALPAGTKIHGTLGKPEIRVEYPDAIGDRLIENPTPVRDEEIGAIRNPWPNLTRLHEEGLVSRPEVRDWILAQAERGMISAYGTAAGRRNIEYLCALEVACEQYLTNHNNTPK